MKTIILVICNIIFDYFSFRLWTHLAYLERGYAGVGGEWLLILVLGAIAIAVSIKIGEHRTTKIKKEK